MTSTELVPESGLQLLSRSQALGVPLHRHLRPFSPPTALTALVDGLFESQILGQNPRCRIARRNGAARWLQGTRRLDHPRPVRGARPNKKNWKP